MNISLFLRTRVPRHAHIWIVMEQNATERILWLACYPLPQNKGKGKTKKAIPFKNRGPLKAINEEKRLKAKALERKIFQAEMWIKQQRLVERKAFIVDQVTLHDDEWKK